MKREKLKKIAMELMSSQRDYMSAFRKNVDIYLDEMDITLKKLSEDADLSYSTLNTFLYGNSKDCNLSTAVKLAKAIGISIDELIGAQTIDPKSQESLALCRAMPDYVVYMIRSFIRHQYKIHSKLDKNSINIPVFLPECRHGYMPTTNVTTTVCIDHLTDDLKSKTCLGIQIPCEHYEPFYMPNEIVLLSADRSGLNNERCVVSYKGNYFFAIKKIFIEDGIKKVKYISLIDGKTQIIPDDIDDKIGYIVGYLNPDKSWGIR